MCVDYHGLNQFTIKNWYLFPLIARLLDQLSHAKVYTNIELCGTYNLMHIRKYDEWKLMFITRYNHFEYVVIPFGLTNALAVFQHVMNDVFCEYLDYFVVCYINDILIFLKNMVNHEHHVRFMFREVCLYAKLEKCGFHQSEVEFWGYNIFRGDICMDLRKVQMIVDWVTLASVWDVQCFFTLVIFYR
jgi:hypothetical protein